MRDGLIRALGVGRGEHHAAHDALRIGRQLDRHAHVALRVNGVGPLVVIGVEHVDDHPAAVPHGVDQHLAGSIGLDVGHEPLRGAAECRDERLLGRRVGRRRGDRAADAACPRVLRRGIDFVAAGHLLPAKERLPVGGLGGRAGLEAGVLDEVLVAPLLAQEHAVEPHRAHTIAEQAVEAERLDGLGGRHRVLLSLPAVGAAAEPGHPRPQRRAVGVADVHVDRVVAAARSPHALGLAPRAEHDGARGLLVEHDLLRGAAALV